MAGGTILAVCLGKAGPARNVAARPTPPAAPAPDTRGFCPREALSRDARCVLGTQPLGSEKLISWRVLPEPLILRTIWEHLVGVEFQKIGVPGPIQQTDSIGLGEGLASHIYIFFFLSSLGILRGSKLRKVIRCFSTEVPDPNYYY